MAAWLYGLASIATFLYVIYAVDVWKPWFHRLRIQRYYTRAHVKAHGRTIGEPGREDDTHQQAGDGSSLQTGQIVRLARLNEDTASSAVRQPTDRPAGTLRVVSWNIEFGYKIDAIVAALRGLDPDVVVIQEADVFGTDSKDVPRILARALGMEGVFAGHYAYERGLWGNAILSKRPISDPRFMALRHIPGYDRSALSAVVETAVGPVLVCGTHFEVCCGISHRLEQLSAVLAHVEARRAEIDAEIPTLVAGDLNTIGSGWARLSPFHCTDRFRWESLGWSEAAWWQEHVFKPGSASHAHLCPLASAYADPFDKDADVTVTNAFLSSKLDWMLLRDGSFAVKAATTGGGSASDHQYLWADLAVLPR